ncbi:hypothetical protein [Cronobacter dublinensis]|uniref:hypothetical protein n=1 Tax=Cronobacter dublinensis TaxID=413497 RepID=UPI00039B5B08|nr:hypothetical protein [Cronobacter dublinensis]
MSEISQELSELRDELKRWQGYYDPVEDKENHEMFVRAADAVAELLALRERADPVVTPKPFLWYGQVSMNVYGCKDGDESRIPLYTAPPAQVVPDVERMKEIYSLFCTPTTGSDNAMVAIHKACRAAMLATPSGKKE